MNPENLAQIKTYALGIAALLYEEAQGTVPEQLKTLSGLEATVRGQLLQYVSPEIALFLSKAPVAPPQGEPEF
ncbi:MAG: hypothetical protein EBE86_033935 [Hormoscilla sp. GUM202]|nr:hypothetical protein [Hormoscilla sp. GM7CHS1pb]MBO1350950.1 hypothetical protein [Hormoscilla sp. GUM202]MBC6480368.1 hypothetical protein [Hormoscilla sp. GM7CHS1pb]MBC6481193.1 hypothetical protein [Hormoscilla sp. GM7CHS1pb]MBC6481908.1 hypothetical protein [Hormoscilla sp. GM7CHS1pb]